MPGRRDRRCEKGEERLSVDFSAVIYCQDDDSLVVQFVDNSMVSNSQRPLSFQRSNKWLAGSGIERKGLDLREDS